MRFPANSSSFSLSLSRKIVSLALPAFGALIAEPIFVLVDSAMIGHLGTAPLAGLGVASTLLQTVVYLFVFLLFSTTTQAARAYGRRDIPAALTTGVQAIYLSVFVGMALAVFLFVGAPWIVSFFDASPAALPHAYAYLRTSAPGVVGMFVVMAATGTLRGMHDTRMALLVSVCGAGLNVVLNAFFIFFLGWGVAGSGAGTSITQLLMATALTVCMVARARMLFSLFNTDSVDEVADVPLRSLVSFSPRIEGIRLSLRDGVWLLVRTVALRVALMATVFVAAQFGVLAVAAHHIVWSVWGFAAYALDALAIAAQTLFASAIGAGEDASGENDGGCVASSVHLLKVLTRWAVCLGGILGVVLLVGIPIIPRLFSADPLVWDSTVAPLVVAAVSLPLAAVVYVYDGIMMGVDRAQYLARWGTILTAFYIPVLWGVMRWSAPADTSVVLGVLWVVYCAIFMGGRALYLWAGSRDLRV